MKNQCNIISTYDVEQAY